MNYQLLLNCNKVHRAGATFNLNIRDELRKAREEVECMKRQNHHLLENNQMLNEVNHDLPKSSGLMFDFCVGKHGAEITVFGHR
jgi:Tfp pilus assembly protein PilO